MRPTGGLVRIRKVVAVRGIRMAQTANETIANDHWAAAVPGAAETASLGGGVRPLARGRSMISRGERGEDRPAPDWTSAFQLGE